MIDAESFMKFFESQGVTFKTLKVISQKEFDKLKKQGEDMSNYAVEVKSAKPSNKKSQ